MIPPKNVEEKGEGEGIAEDWDEMRVLPSMCSLEPGLVLDYL